MSFNLMLKVMFGYILESGLAGHNAYAYYDEGEFDN